MDEMLDPEATSLLDIADAIERSGFAGTVTAGHCCSLSSQHDDLIEKTLTGLRRLGSPSSAFLCVTCTSRTVWAVARRARVVSVAEMAARGINVAASDNTRDPFYAYGDQDMLEVREATRIAHLDHPMEGGAAVTRVAGDIRVAPSLAAFVRRSRGPDLFNAYIPVLYSRPQSDRMVLSKGGQVEIVPLPDYRELDRSVGNYQGVRLVNKAQRQAGTCSSTCECAVCRRCVRAVNAQLIIDVGRGGLWTTSAVILRG